MSCRGVGLTQEDFTMFEVTMITLVYLQSEYDVMVVVLHTFPLDSVFYISIAKLRCDGGGTFGSLFCGSAGIGYDIRDYLLSLSSKKKDGQNKKSVSSNNRENKKAEISPHKRWLRKSLLLVSLALFWKHFQNCVALMKAYEMNPVIHFPVYSFATPLLLACTIWIINGNRGREVGLEVIAYREIKYFVGNEEDIEEFSLRKIIIIDTSFFHKIRESCEAEGVTIEAEVM